MFLSSFLERHGKWMNVFTYQIDLEALGRECTREKKRHEKKHYRKEDWPKLSYLNCPLNLLRQRAKNETVIHPPWISQFQRHRSINRFRRTKVDFLQRNNSWAITPSHCSSIKLVIKGKEM